VSFFIDKAKMNYGELTADDMALMLFAVTDGTLKQTYNFEPRIALRYRRDGDAEQISRQLYVKLLMRSQKPGLELLLVSRSHPDYMELALQCYEAIVKARMEILIYDSEWKSRWRACLKTIVDWCSAYVMTLDWRHRDWYVVKTSLLKVNTLLERGVLRMDTYVPRWSTYIFETIWKWVPPINDNVDKRNVLLIRMIHKLVVTFEFERIDAEVWWNTLADRDWWLNDVHAVNRRRADLVENYTLFHEYVCEAFQKFGGINGGPSPDCGKEASAIELVYEEAQETMSARASERVPGKPSLRASRATQTATQSATQTVPETGRKRARPKATPSEPASEPLYGGTWVITKET